MSARGLLACAAVAALVLAAAAFAGRSPQGLEQVHLADVASRVGLDFRQGAFRFGVTPDVQAMTGGGLCWLDYDNDGRLDLFVVNSYSTGDIGRWERRGGLPRSALFHNVRGRFTNVARRAHADLQVRGQGCVAADFNGDGRTDLFVTAADGDKLLWNNGNGTFTEGARAAGIRVYGWHTGAAVGDVNGDGRPDLYVAGYTDPNVPLPGSSAGFPNNDAGVRDLLYLNLGRDRRGRSRFREVGARAGLEVARFDHSLGATFSDFDHDGRLDLYVANDGDPNRLYVNVAWPGGARADPAGLGFRFEERAAPAGVADPNAGMGVGVGDFNGDGANDVFVSNSRGQGHAVYAAKPPTPAGPVFGDVRKGFATAFGRSFTGWGVSWVDLDLDTDLDLVLANGGIPVTNLARNAQPIQVLDNLTAQGSPGAFVDGSALVGAPGLPKVVGRGLAVGDYDNDGRPDIAINTIGGRLELLHSSGAPGHWLEVRLAPFAPGAVVTAVLPDGTRLVREVHAGSSYASSEDPRALFGLGSATSVPELDVSWPGGAVSRLQDVPVDRIVAVRRASGLVTAPAGAPLESRRAAAIPGCVRSDPNGRSVARVWDEAILDSIRRDLPAPTTHARNLFHLSAAMWDAWASYDPKADGYLVTEKHRAADVQAAREEAISYAAYRLLLWRYSLGANMRPTFDELTSTMRSLCYSPDFTSAKGSSPAALGNRIAAAYIRYGQHDGSIEVKRYADETYVPVNQPLVVADPGTGGMHDPTFWQPLALTQTVAQNGLAVAGNVQVFVGAQWGHVHGFALPASKKGLPIDPGAPPIGTPRSAAYKAAAVDVIRKSAELDPSDGATVDIGLDARGNNPLGTNAGRGYTVNPVTGKPYAPEVVARADFDRILAEFWADGPNSETPPGHWNVLANKVSDSPLIAARIGAGPEKRLEWDVKLYFALNGAVHDAAIAAWGIKRAYQSVRPISMIRYMAERGQSSDPKLPSYDPEGLPLIPGLIELITKESSAPGERHAALADHVGQIAIRAWRGNPADPTTTSGVGWILGTRWVPYQKATFVTPAFPGFISGHSTFSRAAAEVLAAYTGSPYFPGGEFTQVFQPGYLKFEQGPSKPLTLQWATYYDAADQAGISRLYGGIHISPDDLTGRRVGSRVGKAAYALAERYFAGTAR